MAEPSAKYRLIEAKLGQTLAELVEARRPQTSWYRIAEEIERRTGVIVNAETLRLWFRDRITVEARVA